MKKYLLFIATALISGLNAQTLQSDNQIQLVSTKQNTNELNPFSEEAKQSISGDYRAFNETTIGTTIFDLQWYGANQKRIHNNGDGTLSATWMFSGQTSKTPADRGSGYNYYNGTSWALLPGNINSRIETQKTGWPNMIVMPYGKEIIISHRNVDSSLVMTYRNTKGSGSWTEQKLANGYHLFWSRAVQGGANDSTIHVIGNSLTVEDGGALVNGLNGALYYLRSTDGGINWSTPIPLPGIDTTWTAGITGDNYTIDCDGDNVSIVVGAKWMDVKLFKSNDNGLNWTNQLVNDFPYDKFDETKTLVTDTAYTNDGFLEVLIDKNGKSHVWFGLTRLLNTSLTDTSISYYPGINSLIYWNETSAAHPIAYASDLDNTGGIEVADPSSTFPSYGCSLASMPSAGIDASGTIYLVYSAFNELYYSSSLKPQNYRHLYAIKTSDGGLNWSTPNDISPVKVNDNQREYVYPSVARKVDSYLHVIAQEDDEPGLYISSENDLPNYANIIYFKTPITLDVAVKDVQSSIGGMTIYPNPATGNNTTINFNTRSTATATINLYNVLGEKIYNQPLGSLNSGNHSTNLSLQNLSNGLYFVELSNGEEKITQPLVVK